LKIGFYESETDRVVWWLDPHF